MLNSVPRGFRALTNLRSLSGSPAYVDGNWCCLEELGPLSLLKELGLVGLQNVSATSSMAKAGLGAKPHLSRLSLKCGSRLGNDGLLKGVSKEEEQRIEAVFDVICPMPCLEFLLISGYFGRQLPRWILWTATTPLDNLRTLFMYDLACCTQLLDGPCHLPCLEFIGLDRAPAIKRVGPEFVQPYNHRQHASSHTVGGFPRLREMVLGKMVEREEWEWEEEVQAMHVLLELTIQYCRLRSIPRGLSIQARCLKKLTISAVEGIHCLEIFSSVVELTLMYVEDLTGISNFPILEKLEIDWCDKLETVQKMNALRRLELAVSNSEKQLPMYLQDVEPNHFLLDCSPALLASMAVGKSGSEWNQFNHIKKVEAYAHDGGIEKKWNLLYTREPYNMETNIHLQERS